MPYLGQSVQRIDAMGKVTGQTLYPGDINLPNQAYMKILFANRPHARIRSIDTSKAETLEGVIAVFSAKDVPVNEYGLIMPDQPVLCGPGSSKPYAERVRFVGDQVAIIIAETEEIAAKARDVIVVDYEDLPVVSDPLEAMKSEATLLHPDRESNIFCQYRIRKGDVEAAFEQADLVIEGEYHTPAQEHAFLQPEAGLAYIDEAGRVTVEVGGQWTHEDREQIAHALDLPLDQIRVIYPAIGGAFGGREDMSVQIVLALAALRLHQRGIDRPVKVIWSREESIIGHHKRHPYVIKSRWGATREGKVIAAEVEVIADGGAYAYTSTKVLGNATLMCTGPYEIENVKVDSYAVYTNNMPGGAFRGFEGVSIPQVLEQCALAAGWRKTPQGWQRNPADQTSWPSLAPAKGEHIKRGIGFACAFKNVGFSFGAPESSIATVELHGGGEIERVIVHHAGADVGQGAHTVMAQMAAEAAGVPVDRVEMVVSDTAVTDDSGSSSASRMTFMSGNAIKGAVEAALKKWWDEERPAVATYDYVPPSTSMFDAETGYSKPNFTYGYVTQAVAVEVDTETGHVRLLDVVSANDVGKAINLQQVEGQIEGGVVQAAGYAILENFVQKDGYVQTQHLSTYLIPTILDVPERIHPLILEYPDPIGPWGARGMAEMPFLPLVPAIVSAVHDALGVWYFDFPLTPERILRGLGKL
jgi:CO/xanthine dehydrogenase Mo-binding subunit